MDTIGIIGLGKMGGAIGYRLVKAGFCVIGYDPDAVNCHKAAQDGITICSSNQALAAQASIIWLMVPAGKLIDTIISSIESQCTDKIIVDGGNSFFKDSIRRHHTLQHKNIAFVDCGTSGGIYGRTSGFCLMVGGDQRAVAQITPACNAIATSKGFVHVGPAGAGHYVKMVHNGIEYALMQSYAQGLHLIHEGYFAKDQLDLAAITDLWNRGSVIRSWLLELTHNIFVQHGQALETISGSVKESGMGLWTTQEAAEHAICVSLIQEALDIRHQSQQTGGNYSTKLVALMRNQFGGHSYTTKDGDEHT